MATTVAFTIALGNKASAGARLTRRTFKAVHPDIPFFIIEGEFYHFFAQQQMAAHPGEIMGLRAMVGYFLALAFDRVLYFDADVLVVSPLPRLVEGPEPVVLTNDVPECHYGIPAPLINAGVLAASPPSFWRNWMLAIYAHLLPVIGNFFDQFILRVLCQGGSFPYVLLPEKEEKDYYNISHRHEPGEWRLRDGLLYQGEARVRLWHWAGFSIKPTLADLPPPVAEAVGVRLAAVGPGDRMEEMDLLRAAIRQNGEAFLKIIAGDMQSMRTFCLDGISVATIVYPDLYGTDVPAVWDALRPLPEGFHRRLLPKAGRFLYAREEARLHEADIAALDRPGVR